MEATDQNLLKMIKDDISERILSRIDPSYLEEVCKDEKFVVIAGNSLNKAKPHDIDVYRFLDESAEEKPVETVLQVGYSGSQPVRAVAKLDWCIGQGGPHRIVYESANARTVKHNDTTYQYCAYQKPFHKLIESFDFAHVQVGAVLDLKSHKITEVYFTDKYVRWLLTGKSCFTGSEFPLSSLLRAEKYKRYEVLNSHEFRTCVLTALGDVIERGFEDYDDFKKQLEAVDLLLLEDDESNAAYRLYAICENRKLVRKPRNIKLPEDVKKMEEEYWGSASEDTESGSND